MVEVPSETRKYTVLHKADTKLDSRCWWLEEKAEITGSVLQCLVGSTISTFVSNLYTFGSVMVRVFFRRQIDGGAAKTDGKLCRGDQILTVNGKDISTAKQDEAVAVLKMETGAIKLKVQRFKFPARE